MNRADAAVHSLEKNAGVSITSSEILKLGGHIEGKILTIVEASVVDKTQQEAMKSLVRQAIWSDLEQVTKWMAGQDQENNMGGTFPF